MTTTPRQRRSRTLWRAAFIAYAVSLTVATHWPSLDLSTAGAPAADKLVHLFAFALLGAFLWQAAWILRLWMLLALLLMWVLVDEWTQSLPILDREFSWQDVIASACGVVASVAWIAALRPLGGEHNRMRLALQRGVFDDLYASPLSARGFAAWSLLALAIVPIMLALLLMLPPIIDSPYTQRPRMLVLTVGTALWIGLVLGAWQALWRRAFARAIDTRACPGCGSSIAGDAFDQAGDGWSACAACGGRVHRGIWLPQVSPDAAAMRRMARAPAALSLGLLIAGAAVLYGSMKLYERLVVSGSEYAGAAQTTAQAINNLSDDFVVTLDLTLLLLIGALSLWIYRRSLARFHDMQDRICRTCGHDLRGTPSAQGIGRCGECGTQFARL